MRPLESDILSTTKGRPVPPGCPKGCLYVPPRLRSQVLQFCHSSKLSVHPGITRTGKVVHQRFWWPSVWKDVRDYVLTCPTCVRVKGEHQAPAGMLHPLPVPRRPWSHISMDFVTGLPVSKGCSVVFTVVDRFSKMAHFVPLPKLPSAPEAAQILIDHVIRLHGFPEDVVSDRGPQFVDWFWMEFCRILGITISLSSGFHPQSNGQSERLNPYRTGEGFGRCALTTLTPGRYASSGLNMRTIPYLAVSVPGGLWLSAPALRAPVAGYCSTICGSLRTSLPPGLEEGKEGVAGGSVILSGPG